MQGSTVLTVFGAISEMIFGVNRDRLRYPHSIMLNNGNRRTVLSDMDAEIAALERRRDKTRVVKQGMMQQLLTGRVRQWSESGILTRQGLTKTTT